MKKLKKKVVKFQMHHEHKNVFLAIYSSLDHNWCHWITTKMFSLSLFFNRWIEKVNLKVRATCAYPPELKGRKVKDVHVFRACPGGEGLPPAPTANPKSAKAPKATKPKPMHLSGHQHGKLPKGKSKPHKSSNAKTPATRKSIKTHSSAWILFCADTYIFFWPLQ